MKKLICFLMLIGAVSLFSQPEYPGDVLNFEIRGGSDFLFPLMDNQGQAGRLSLDFLVDSIWKESFLSVNGDFIWYSENDEYYNIPKVSLSAGYDFLLADTVRIRPYGAVGASAMFLSENEDWLPMAELGTDISINLYNESFFHIRGSILFPSQEDLPAMAGFGLGISKSNGVLLPYRTPEMVMAIEPEYFSPDSDGLSDELLINISTKRPRNVGSWNLNIYDSQGELFYEMGGDGAAPSVITWDGRSTEGEVVSSASQYSLSLQYNDILGNSFTQEDSFQTDILVVRDGENWKIRIPSIHFPPGSGNFGLLSNEDQIRSNSQILDRLTEIIQRFPNYQIQIEGHANYLSSTEAERRLEQEEILIPLSLERAESVRQSLMERGIDGERLSSIGMGGAVPLYPMDDEEQRWKNRRVEFILIK